jgi:hypothetical protein
MRARHKPGGLSTLLLLLPVSVIVAGCSHLLFKYEGAMIKAGHAVPIVAGGHQRGRYITHDVTIDYSYEAGEKGLKISGTVLLADYLRYNDYGLRYFHLSLLAGDEENTVLKNYPLLSTGYRPQITFDRTLELPQGSTTMVFAFTYTGQSISGGEGGGSWDFWGVPLVRGGGKR